MRSTGPRSELPPSKGASNRHGFVYDCHQADAWNATPFFSNQYSTLRDPNA